MAKVLDENGVKALMKNIVEYVGEHSGGSSGDSLPLTGGTIDGDLTITGTITGYLNGTAANADSADKLGNDDVGSGTKFIYLDNGEAKASASTVGSGTKFIYMSKGVITASAATVGNIYTPVYLDSGTLKATTATIGSGTKPVYMDSGKITASTASVGSGTRFVYLSSGNLVSTTSNIGNESKFVYMDSGTLKATSKSLGSATKPLYLNNGKFELCSDFTQTSGGIVASSLSENGYIKFSNGFLIQWGYYKSNRGNVRYPIGFSSAVYSVTLGTNVEGNAYHYITGVNTSYFSLYYYSAGDSEKYGCYWMAMGV